MPDQPPEKLSPHPAVRSQARIAPISLRNRSDSCLTPYAELSVTSNFSFLRGASHPEEMVERAAQLGHAYAAIADRNSLAGIVRAHLAAKEAGIGLAVGCRLVLAPSAEGGPAPPEILVFATDRRGYGALCTLLTDGKLRAEKGQCHLVLEDLVGLEEGLVAVVMPAGLDGEGVVPLQPDGVYAGYAREIVERFGAGNMALGAAMLGMQGDEVVLRAQAKLAEEIGVPLCALNDAHYHDASRRSLQDVMNCIRLGKTVREGGLALFPNLERRLRTPESMASLFRRYPRALDQAVALAERAAAFSLDQLDHSYPREVEPGTGDSMAHLGKLAREGAKERYPRGVPERVRVQIERELVLIGELDYAPYFLTVHDLVRFARSRGILCQGRGAAANSAVCYCLGVTSVDPARGEMLFERFVSAERNEPPDIDIDFEHERREEVIQFLYAKYGRRRAALTATVISYRSRSAIREVGKALGMSPEVCDRLAKNVEWWHGDIDEALELEGLGLDRDSLPMRQLHRLSRELLGFPRHLSQHVGGFVITDTPLCELVPIENASMEGRTVIEWDKDDLDAMGILKVDVLGLGMLTAIRRCCELVDDFSGPGTAPLLPPGGFTPETIPAEDPAVYDMLCEADTVGVFQVESRAQMSMLPRLKPRNFYDLVIEVAIVRPGPVHGDMVHPYLRRRNGEEPVVYPSPEVRDVLGRTLGVPLFQEQVMRLAVVAGGFTAGQADELRRAMAAWKRKTSHADELGQKLVEGMLERGYGPDFADRIRRQLQGFSEYGFPESHAASFALLVYVSSWLKLYHPAAFAAALINSQPMGFYAPAQLVADAKDHGVEVLPIDVNHSNWDCTLVRVSEDAEPGPAKAPAIRLGMRLVKGLREATAESIAEAVEREGPFTTPFDLHRAAGIPASSLRPLARADAFQSMGLDRQASAWSIRALRDEPMELWERCTESGTNRSDFAAKSERFVPDSIHDLEGAEALPRVDALEEVVRDYTSQGLSLRAHPIAFLRDQLTRRGAIRSDELRDPERTHHGTTVELAGLVLVRQRPGTAKGILFMTIEDEAGTANLILHPSTYEEFRPAARHGVFVLVEGRVDRLDRVVHLIVQRIERLDLPRAGVAPVSRDFR